MLLPIVRSFEVSQQMLPALLYVGPDVLMPVMSALAAVVGLLLTFWRRVVGIIRRLFNPGQSHTRQSEQTSRDGLG